MSKGLKLDTVKVIVGGENPWACVEMKTLGTSVTGD